MQAHTPRRLTALTRSKISAGSSAASLGGTWMPALFNAMSSRPNVSTVAFTTAATLSSSDTSQRTPSTWWLTAVRSSAAELSVLSLISAGRPRNLINVSGQDVRDRGASLAIPKGRDTCRGSGSVWERSPDPMNTRTRADTTNVKQVRNPSVRAVASIADCAAVAATTAATTPKPNPPPS
jgi:hypothetical protein